MTDDTNRTDLPTTGVDTPFQADTPRDGLYLLATEGWHTCRRVAAGKLVEPSTADAIEATRYHRRVVAPAETWDDVPHVGAGEAAGVLALMEASEPLHAELVTVCRVAD